MRPKHQHTRIMVFGTFDVLHKGHLHFFYQARKLAKSPFLIVSVARDANVKKIKGKKPRQPEQKRLAAIKKIKLVNQALLGNKKNYWSHIIKSRPDVIALGYDQVAYTRNLKKILAQKGLRVKISRLRAYKPHLYKSSLIKQSTAGKVRENML